MLSDHLSITYAALADPTRRAILARLAAGEATVGELAEPFTMSLPAVSKHLKVLERAGHRIKIAAMLDRSNAVASRVDAGGPFVDDGVGGPAVP